MRQMLCCVTLALTAVATQASAAYPDRPITLVVPYAPGGSTDAMARGLANELSKELGQPVIVENKPGANTIIASSTVARAKPDGYTVLVASSASMVLNPLLYNKLNYNPDKDLRLLAVVAEAPLVIVANDKVPASTLPEFVSYARAHANQVNYGSVGLGNPLQLATELLKSELDFEATHVPFNGSAPALASLLAGDTQLMIDIVSTSLPHIRSGRLKALAVTGDDRLAVLPDVPTVAESAVPGFRAATWFGVVVPSETPPEVAQRLQDAVSTVMVTPAFKTLLQTQTLIEQPVRSDAELASYVGRDRDTWGKVIRERNIVLD